MSSISLVSLTISNSGTSSPDIQKASTNGGGNLFEQFLSMLNGGSDNSAAECQKKDDGLITASSFFDAKPANVSNANDPSADFIAQLISFLQDIEQSGLNHRHHHNDANASDTMDNIAADAASASSVLI